MSGICSLVHRLNKFAGKDVMHNLEYEQKNYCFHPTGKASLMFIMSFVIISIATIFLARKHRLHHYNRCRLGYSFAITSRAFAHRHFFSRASIHNTMTSANATIVLQNPRPLRGGTLRGKKRNIHKYYTSDELCTHRFSNRRIFPKSTFVISSGESSTPNTRYEVLAKSSTG